MITLLIKLPLKVRHAERKATAQDLMAFPEMTRRLQTAHAPFPTPAAPRRRWAGVSFIGHARTRRKRRDAPREVPTQLQSPTTLPASGRSSWVGPGGRSRDNRQG